MTLRGLGPTVFIIILAILSSGIDSAHIWPFANLCPTRGTFPMVPGCRIFCLCFRPGGAGRLLACPETHRFNPKEERCTPDPEVCEANKQCDPPALLEKAEELQLKDLKSDCDSTSMSYCANRWELIVCHPVWSHMLGVIECDRHGDGSHICNIMTDSCEKNRSALWDSSAGIDSAAFGTATGDDCERPVDDEYPEESVVYTTMCCPPTLCYTADSEPTVGTTRPTPTTARPTPTSARPTTSSARPTTATERPTQSIATDPPLPPPTQPPTLPPTDYEDGEEEEEETTTALATSRPTSPPATVTEPDDDNDPCNLIGDWPGAECKAMGSWCLPDSETIVTCGESKEVRQVRNCKEEFAKHDLEGACLPLVFGCAYWQRNPVSDAWVPNRSEHAADHQHEAFEGWFREHWCKTHGRRGVLCTPDGQSLAHCNEDLLVDSVFHCASVEPKGLLKGCHFCEPGTAFCIYRPRADIADQCGVPPEGDDHDAACGFVPREARGVPEVGNSSVPYPTNATTTTEKEKNVTSTDRTGP